MSGWLETGLRAPCWGKGWCEHGAVGPHACLHAAGLAASSGNALHRLFLCCVKKHLSASAGKAAWRGKVN